jgi:hypothetical protein
VNVTNPNGSIPHAAYHVLCVFWFYTLRFHGCNIFKPVMAEAGNMPASSDAGA